MSQSQQDPAAQAAAFKLEYERFRADAFLQQLAGSIRLILLKVGSPRQEEYLNAAGQVARRTAYLIPVSHQATIAQLERERNEYIASTYPTIWPHLEHFLKLASPDQSFLSPSPN